jgi:hypothetical protein
MTWLWVVLGVVTLVVGFPDTFLTVFNYTEAGFLHPPICRAAGERCDPRSGACRSGRPRRAPQVMGGTDGLVIVVWLTFTIVGYG